jgi:hypothetical protein
MNSVFNVWHSKYKVVLNKVAGAFNADAQCKKDLGPQATLARITHEQELVMISRALVSLNIDFNRGLWIGGSPRESGLVTKWAECEPSE